METIVIGKIVKAQGIKGEVKIMPITDNIERFQKLKGVFINTQFFTVETLRIQGGFVCVKFKEIPDRNAAENLKDKYIEVDKKDAVKPKDGSYYIADLIGCAVLTDSGEKLGRISEILQYGAADVIIVQADNKKTISFPFLNDSVAKIDISKKEFIVKKEALERTAVYDD